jgi:ribonucleotide reductase beta subunit family protein with ferritin-like domain
MYQSQIDLQSFFIGLEAISKYTSTILVTINNTVTSLISEFKTGLEQNRKYPIKIVNRSNYMIYLANDKMTPFDIKGIFGASEKPLKVLQKQLKEMFTFIMEY